MKKTILISFILLFGLPNLQAQDKSTSITSASKINTNDDYDYIAINQMKMWIGNNGMGSHNPYTDEAGLLWPGGENAILSLTFMDGLLWGGYIGDSLFVNGNTFRQGLQAGKILENGLADDPSLPKYRIYKIRKDWEELVTGPTRDKYQKDYEEWPTEDGAPFYDSNNDEVYTDGIDKPLFLGDEVLWCVMNDMDPNRTLYTFGTGPIGLEVQMTVYGFKSANVLRDVIFKKYIIINKSQNTIDSMYFGYWSDPDLGYGGDDYDGCDTLLHLAYCYNADNIDNVYEENPPAVGYLLLQGTTIKGLTNDSARINSQWITGIKDHKMTSFTPNSLIINAIFDPCWTIPQYIQAYNFLNALICDGSPYVNPLDNMITKYPFSGNPVDSTGWYMGYQNLIPSGDMRMLMNTGPITMAPGDTQEVVIAIIVAQGSDYLQSVAELKKTAKTVQYFYDHYIPDLVNENYVPPSPEYYYLGQNYPNPFNPTTSISYELPVSGLVSLKVFDILGREVATLVEEEKEAGTYQVNFSSGGLSSGIYFYTLTSREYSRTKKMVLLR